jgi:hypothetical protein
VIFLIDLLNSELIFLALCGREFLVKKVLLFDLYYRVLLAYALGNKLFKGF